MKWGLEIGELVVQSYIPNPHPKINLNLFKNRFINYLMYIIQYLLLIFIKNVFQSRKRFK